MYSFYKERVHWKSLYTRYDYHFPIICFVTEISDIKVKTPCFRSLSGTSPVEQRLRKWDADGNMWGPPSPPVLLPGPGRPEEPQGESPAPGVFASSDRQWPAKEPWGEASGRGLAPRERSGRTPARRDICPRPKWRGRRPWAQGGMWPQPRGLPCEGTGRAPRAVLSGLVFAVKWWRGFFFE